MKDDSYYMKLAIENAKAMKGQTSPNPLVGAILVKDGKIVGIGAHLQAGEPHAEIHALQMAGQKAKDAVMFVTLEPCAHHGKTGSCTEALMKSGVKRVVIASKDPNPLVSGKGVAMLKKAGIEIEEGLCREEAVRLNAPFFHSIQYNRPFVTLKTAISLDGKIATSKRESKWITGEEARQDVQCIRQESDAIITGVETVIQDDPSLTVRRKEVIQPVRVILDSKLRIPLFAKCLTDGKAETIICTSRQYDKEKREQLENKGVNVFVTSGRKYTNLPDVLRMLRERSMMSVLIEAGGHVNASFLEAGLVNEVVIYMAPIFIGGQKAPTFFEGNGFERLAETIRVTEMKSDMMGSDMKLTLRLSSH
ncbi:bifunctional diaminohydroxyphosphoribosylaminopyrimidine deaminase/5-amino-6-(5-phosphoribosylamino)uracil reductase RibD [Bacillus sp. NPDC077027]|uniref:bifunctional diaminohydroxyphosphoribosylaminopyrimidine deaminase/5-amino-6-(5-phosphoribosylamino)uracil reductase RibD n=1 Tax=Bacillus sp. NPDC077027 TaxID=3390548 RepID=UPI003D0076A5